MSLIHYLHSCKIFGLIEINQYLVETLIFKMFIRLPFSDEFTWTREAAGNNFTLLVFNSKIIGTVEHKPVLNKKETSLEQKK
jgi:hypothetical protein